MNFELIFYLVQMTQNAGKNKTNQQLITDNSRAFIGLQLKSMKVWRENEVRPKAIYRFLLLS